MDIIKAILASFIILLVLFSIGFFLYKVFPLNTEEPKCDNCIEFATEEDFVKYKAFNSRLSAINLELQELEDRVVERESKIISCFEFGGKPVFDYKIGMARNDYLMQVDVQCEKNGNILEYTTTQSSNWVKVE